jgi:hypothetical protein
MKNKILVALFSAALFTSCVSIHSGMTSSSASLSSNNFNYIAQGVQGSASIVQYVALVPGFRQTLINDAKNEILKKYPLKNNQALANITVDIKSNLILGPVVRTTKCTVTADIIEFIK